jgi:hypothetical protein
LPGPRGLGGEDQVVQHRQALEQAGDLERSHQAAPRTLVGAERGDVLARQQHTSAIAAQLTGQLRHQRGLAGAIGADQRVDAAGLHLQVDLVGDHQAAEALGQALHVEQRRHRGLHNRSRPAFTAPARPWRANSTTASNTQPVQNSPCSLTVASPSCSSSSAAAPNTPPSSDPAPPRITITSSVPLCVQCSALGLT